MIMRWFGRGKAKEEAAEEALENQNPIRRAKRD